MSEQRLQRCRHPRSVPDRAGSSGSQDQSLPGTPPPLLRGPCPKGLPDVVDAAAGQGSGVASKIQRLPLHRSASRRVPAGWAGLRPTATHATPLKGHQALETRTQQRDAPAPRSVYSLCAVAITDSSRPLRPGSFDAAKVAPNEPSSAAVLSTALSSRQALVAVTGPIPASRRNDQA